MVPFMNMWLLLNWMLTASVYLRLSKFGCGLTNEQQKKHKQERNKKQQTHDSDWTIG